MVFSLMDRCSSVSVDEVMMTEVRSSSPPSIKSRSNIPSVVIEKAKSPADVAMVTRLSTGDTSTENLAMTVSKPESAGSSTFVDSTRYTLPSVVLGVLLSYFREVGFWKFEAITSALDVL